jgi:hypothetical protein
MFNDPFDVTQELRLDFDETKLNAVLNETWISLIEQGDPSNSVKNPIFATALRMTLSLSPEMRRKIANDHRRQTVTTTPGQIKALAELKNMWRRLVLRIPLKSPPIPKQTGTHCGANRQSEKSERSDAGILFIA